MNILRIRPEERAIAAFFLLVVGVFNALTVCRYYPELTLFQADYHTFFRDNFHLSGFDAWSYAILSSWNGWEFNIYRHPLLALFFLPLALINRYILMPTLGLNGAIFIMAGVETLFGTYSAVFLFRLLREAIGLRRADSWLLVILYFSFAFVLISTFVPDHFNLSMCLLLLTLWLCGRKIRQKEPLKAFHTALLFVLSGGISLTNGVKIGLAAAFTNGRKLLRWRYVLPAIVVPAGLLWLVATAEFQYWAAPRLAQMKAQEKAKDRAWRDSIYQAEARKSPDADPKTVKQRAEKVIKAAVWAKYKRNHAREWIGKPMSKTGFMAWTDKTTNRWRVIKENLFGESLQLHRANLLQDIVRDNRPMVVPYEADWHYMVEGLTVGLFLLGVWFGRKHRLMWLALAWFLFDMALFIGLGFGINEVYIMTSQWAFVIPIALGYALKGGRRWTIWALRCAIAGLAMLYTGYNIPLILQAI